MTHSCTPGSTAPHPHPASLLALSTLQTELTAYEKFPEPREMDVTRVLPNKQKVGQAFKKDAKAVQEALEALGEADALCMKVGGWEDEWVGWWVARRWVQQTGSCD